MNCFIGFCRQYVKPVAGFIQVESSKNTGEVKLIHLQRVSYASNRVGLAIATFVAVVLFVEQ